MGGSCSKGKSVRVDFVVSWVGSISVVDRLVGMINLCRGAEFDVGELLRSSIGFPNDERVVMEGRKGRIRLIPQTERSQREELRW